MTNHDVPADASKKYLIDQQEDLTLCSIKGIFDYALLKRPRSEYGLFNL